MEKPQIEQRTWDEFRESGLLWFINTTLHLFGWALVFEIEEGKAVSCFPARVTFRGFDEKSNDEGYIKVTKYLKNTIENLEEEVNS